MWMSEERHLTEVNEKWGVLLLTNITDSTNYTCSDGEQQSEYTFTVVAVGKC